MLSMYRAAASVAFRRDKYAGDEEGESKCLNLYFFCPLVTNSASQFLYDNAPISNYYSFTILYCACRRRIRIQLQLVLHGILVFYTRPLSAFD